MDIIFLSFFFLHLVFGYMGAKLPYITNNFSLREFMSLTWKDYIYAHQRNLEQFLSITKAIDSFLSRQFCFQYFNL